MSAPEPERGPEPDPDLVSEPLDVAGRALDVLRPRDPEALVTHEAFGPAEFLPYWAELWPSAPVLAGRLAERDVRDVPVLELGCGLGVTGLALAAHGARVTATDWSADALALLARNAERNGLVVDVRLLDWFASPPADDERWPLVVAADVLYESRNRAALLTTLDRVLAPGGEAWIADPGRPAAAPFWPQAEAAGWDVTALERRAGEEATVRILRRTRD